MTVTPDRAPSPACAACASSTSRRTRPTPGRTAAFRAWSAPDARSSPPPAITSRCARPTRVRLTAAVGRRARARLADGLDAARLSESLESPGVSLAVLHAGRPAALTCATHARDFDVAHLHACRNLPGAIAAHHLRRAGVPYVLAPNGTAPVIERRLWPSAPSTGSAAGACCGTPRASSPCPTAERAQLRRSACPGRVATRAEPGRSRRIRDAGRRAAHSVPRHGLGDSPARAVPRQDHAAQAARRAGRAPSPRLRIRRPPGDRRQRHGRPAPQALRALRDARRGRPRRCDGSARPAAIVSKRSPTPTSSSIRRRTRSSGWCRSRRCLPARRSSSPTIRAAAKWCASQRTTRRRQVVPVGDVAALGARDRSACSPTEPRGGRSARRAGRSVARTVRRRDVVAEAWCPIYARVVRPAPATGPARSAGVSFVVPVKNGDATIARDHRAIEPSPTARRSRSSWSTTAATTTVRRGWPSAARADGCAC